MVIYPTTAQRIDCVTEPAKRVRGDDGLIKLQWFVVSNSLEPSYVRVSNLIRVWEKYL
jgi:hypothetical protein